MELSENEIQNSLLELLRYHGISGVRINNGSVYDPTNKAFRKKNKWEVEEGTPLDIFVFLPDGKNCWIEVKKNEKEKATAGQVQWIEKVRKENGIAFVAWSLKQVKEELKYYLTRKSFPA